MKSFARAFTLALIAVGMISTCFNGAARGGSFLEYKAAREKMPIPVCPPNDPDACHIEKW